MIRTVPHLIGTVSLRERWFVLNGLGLMDFIRIAQTITLTSTAAPRAALQAEDPVLNGIVLPLGTGQ